MKLLSNKFIGIFVIALGSLLSIYYYKFMPDIMVSHWGLYGEANGYSSKSLALFLMPAMSLFLFVLFLFLPKLDPLHKNIKLFEKNYTLFINVVLIFLLYLHVLTLAWNLGYTFNFIVYLTPAFSLLSYSIGILMENAKRNWFIGIRTPWTLSSDKVWDKTHKVGSKLYKYISLFLLLGIVFPNYTFFLMIFSLVGVSLSLVFYSYLEFRKL